MRIEVRQNGGTSGLIKTSAGQIIGHQIKCKIVKNKIDIPYKEAIMELIYGVGINRSSELVTVALASGIIRQGGAWFTYLEEGSQGHFKIQGRDNLEAYLKEQPEIMATIEQGVMEGLHL